METLEDLKVIIANKPSDGLATHIDENEAYVRSDNLCDSYFDGEGWIYVDNLTFTTRSLSDIELIIELHNELDAFKSLSSKAADALCSVGSKDGVAIAGEIDKALGPKIMYSLTSTN